MENVTKRMCKAECRISEDTLYNPGELHWKIGKLYSFYHEGKRMSTLVETEFSKTYMLHNIIEEFFYTEEETKIHLRNKKIKKIKNNLVV